MVLGYFGTLTFLPPSHLEAMYCIKTSSNRHYSVLEYIFNIINVLYMNVFDLRILYGKHYKCMFIILSAMKCVELNSLF